MPMGGAGDRHEAGSGDRRSPDRLAPLVAYLASERSAWITGRIVHAMELKVALYNNPQPVGPGDRHRTVVARRAGGAGRAFVRADARPVVTMPTSKPVPEPTPETQPFWDGCAAGELRLQRCTICGQAYFYPRPVCP